MILNLIFNTNEFLINDSCDSIDNKLELINRKYLSSII
jgi:hypothetical protein